MNAQDRVRYMGAVLARWKEEGLTTPEAARASYSQRTSTTAKLDFEKDNSVYARYFDDEEDTTL